MKRIEEGGGLPGGGQGGDANGDVDDAEIDHAARIKFGTYLAMVVGTMVGGGLIMCMLEGWTLVSGFYWAFQTTTTVGYGDASFTNPISYAFGALFALFSVILVGFAMGKMASAFAEAAFEKKRRALFRKELDMDMILLMDADGSGSVDKGEFVIGVLTQLGVIEADDVTPWLQRFEELDEDGSGELDRDDLARLSAPPPSPATPAGVASRSGTLSSPDHPPLNQTLSLDV